MRTTSTDKQLDVMFAALANPTRRAIVARLALGDATVNELAAPFRLQLPAVSKHIKVLEQAGLIERTRDAQFRRCRLAPERLAEVSTWADQHRRLWIERFNRLDRQLEQQQLAPGESTLDRKGPKPS